MSNIAMFALSKIAVNITLFIQEISPSITEGTEFFRRMGGAELEREFHGKGKVRSSAVYEV